MDTKVGIRIDRRIKPLKVDLKGEQVDILIVLSDNEGYSKTELAKITDIRKSYVVKLLNELSSYEFGDLSDSLSIQYFHLKDPLSLAHKIEDQRDQISKYIYKNMYKAVIETFTNSNKYIISLFLAVGLNHILFDENFYNGERFSGVKLSEDARKLIALKKDLKGGSIRILNRILIEDTYPDEICQTRIPLIHELSRSVPGKSRHPYFINSDLRTFILIVEHLKNNIILDRNIIEVMKTRLKIELKPFRGIEKFCEEDPSILEQIKIGKMDLNYYTSRYNEDSY